MRHEADAIWKACESLLAFFNDTWQILDDAVDVSSLLGNRRTGKSASG